MNTQDAEHIPVLADILAEQIRLPKDGIMVDATIGHGGHSLLFGRQLGPEGAIIGMDFDEKSIQRAHSKLSALPCKRILINENFSRISEELRKRNIEKVDFILADLGICSRQLTDRQTGLGFQQDMPLDMRIDKRIQTTAADIVNKADQNSLADLIYKYGEDRASRRIARFIVEHRKKQEIGTTGQLAAIVSKALWRPGKRRSRIHPATRTFQALRIAVNNELENLEKLLVQAPNLLKTGGQIAIISFHSLEDRMVKNDFKEKNKEGIYRIMTKKPITPTKDEISKNKRARSAKLRIAEKQ